MPHSHATYSLNQHYFMVCGLNCDSWRTRKGESSSPTPTRRKIRHQTLNRRSRAGLAAQRATTPSSASNSMLCPWSKNPRRSASLNYATGVYFRATLSANAKNLRLAANAEKSATMSFSAAGSQPPATAPTTKEEVSRASQLTPSLSIRRLQRKWRLPRQPQRQ